jgi:hypothetical protein
MVQGGVSVRRLTDDRIRHAGDNSYRKDVDPAMRDGPRCILLVRFLCLTGGIPRARFVVAKFTHIILRAAFGRPFSLRQ